MLTTVPFFTFIKCIEPESGTYSRDNFDVRPENWDVRSESGTFGPRVGRAAREWDVRSKVGRVTVQQCQCVNVGVSLLMSNRPTDTDDKLH